MKVQVDFSKIPEYTPYQLAVFRMYREDHLESRGITLSEAFSILGGPEEIVDDFLDFVSSNLTWEEWLNRDSEEEEAVLELGGYDPRDDETPGLQWDSEEPGSPFKSVLG